MNLLTDFTKTLARRLSFAATRTGGGSATSSPLIYAPHSLTNTRGFALDYEAEAGDVLNNSVVAACVNAICQALPEAPIHLEKRVGGNEFERIDSHPVLDLLHNPNPYLSEAELWGVTTAYERTRGEAFWYFEYDQNGSIPREIWFRAPEFVQIKSDAGRFISGYDITAESGQVVSLDEGDVVHFRHQLSTTNPRAGWSPIQTGKRQIVGDNGAASYHSSILRNAGAASLIISLKDAAAAGEVTPGQLDEYVQRFKKKVAGAGAGAVLGLDLPLDIHKVGFSPDEMALEKLLEYYESRICALMGVNRRVINLGSDPTYENSRVALNDFWERTIVPMRRRHASTLSSQLLPLFGLDPSIYRLRFDFSEVEALRENLDALHARWRATFAAGGIDLFTFQEKIGLKPDEWYRGRYVKPSRTLAGGDEVKAVWNEADHPRNLLGQFESGGGGSHESNSGQGNNTGGSNSSGSALGFASAHNTATGEAKKPEKKLNFANVKEAEAWAAARGVKANYGTNRTMGQQINRVLQAAEERGLRIPANIRFTAFNNDDPAQSSAQGISLELNTKFKLWDKGTGAVERKTQDMFNKRDWSTPHKDHILRHEIGHMNRRAHSGFGVLLEAEKSLIETEVSARAAMNPDEFIAEMVAKLWDNPKGEGVDLKIMELYKKHGGPDMSKEPETKSLRIGMSQCAQCIHYKGGRNSDGTVRPRACPAFPDRIPDEVYWGEFDHTQPYPGDNGVRFEKEPEIEYEDEGEDDD